MTASSVSPGLVPIHPELARVTERIERRSQRLRSEYLEMLRQSKKQGRARKGLGCANAAHAYAAMPTNDKLILQQDLAPNLGIVTAYNDMLSAHQPYEHYPELIRSIARESGATAQVAGGVPAMCDGVTQGEPGMELSLHSRDVIAMATAVGLSHNTYDAAVLLGICDKIVPGLFMGALQFGHLPVVMLPAGPMTSGLSNDEKSKVRQQYAQGLVSREELMRAEQAAYHGAGTCTFYGTANSNQMLMEMMGMQLPGSSFVNPNTPLRAALNRAGVQAAIALSELCKTQDMGMGYQITAKAVVNGMVGLLATGGSTNHTLHLVAMARAAGWSIDWQDFSDLSSVVPLLAKVYPNGKADVNHFHAAGGMPFLTRELLASGLLHNDVQTIRGMGLHHHTQEPWLDGETLSWRDAPAETLDDSILRPAGRPFAKDGGIRLVLGSLGRSVVKVSAVDPAHRLVTAPAKVFNDQKEMAAAFQRGELECDFIAVVRFQGPAANGMPELHKLTPILGVLQDRGFHVALVTDGRMSGASGKVPAAIHLYPEAAEKGAIAKLRNGDLLRLDCDQGVLELVEVPSDWGSRPAAEAPTGAAWLGAGRSLFELPRKSITNPEQGATFLFRPSEQP